MCWVRCPAWCRPSSWARRAYHRTRLGRAQHHDTDVAACGRHTRSHPVPVLYVRSGWRRSVSSKRPCVRPVVAASRSQTWVKRSSCRADRSAHSSRIRPLLALTDASVLSGLGQVISVAIGQTRRRRTCNCYVINCNHIIHSSAFRMHLARRTNERQKIPIRMF